MLENAKNLFQILIDFELRVGELLLTKNGGTVTKNRVISMYSVGYEGYGVNQYFPDCIR